ncbi:MAG: NADP-dependent malic enzyme, partial [Proteobacteria bacterium]|nr:NADP-dependent malic enzyme [Pseudomonadota bacterium]
VNLLVTLGLKPANVTLTDIKGVVYKGRNELMNPYLERYAKETRQRTLADAIAGADVLLGLSAARVVSKEMVASMAPKPLVFALANPTPEILPELVKEVRDDAVIATGRTDYPNQINNVLCFPFIFRGALDVGATQITEEMKAAAVTALAGIAESEASDIVLAAYGAETFVFGPEYLLPKPFDPRLITEIAPAVAKAAMESGVATRPIEDYEAYRQKLNGFVYRSGFVMRPVFDAARRAHQSAQKRLVYAEGEHPYVLQCAQQVITERIARPLLVGSKASIARSITHLGLRMREGRDYDVFDLASDPRRPALTEEYQTLVERRGVSPSHAERIVRNGSTVVAGLLLKRGDADAMICGAVGRYLTQLRHVSEVIGKLGGVRGFAALSSMILPSGPLFVADTHVSYDPDAEHLAEITLLAAEQVRRFGIEPKVALLSHSSFGSENTKSAQKMREVLSVLRDWSPELEVEGEMHADAALSPFIRDEIFPNSRLHGAANLLIAPGVDSANIAFNLLKVVSSSVAIGPILLGAALPAHIVTPSITVRGLLNVSAVAIVDAARARGEL